MHRRNLPSIWLCSSITATISAIASSRPISSSPSFALFLSDPVEIDPAPEFPLPLPLPLSSSTADTPRFRLAGVPGPPPLVLQEMHLAQMNFT